MRYENMVSGRFLRRPNRFIAQVELNGREETVHVKSTGRCRELLVPGATVWCQHWGNSSRKTAWDLIAVRKGERLINMDSQAPNRAALEWLQSGGLGELSELRPEVKSGDSRLDFGFRKEGRPCFLEVKGCTLEEDGHCAFPDAPTERGTRHLLHLADLARAGFGAYVLFVVQMEGVLDLRPHDGRDPAFGAALRQAARAGVEILAMDCRVTPESMQINAPVPVLL